MQHRLYNDLLKQVWSSFKENLDQVGEQFKKQLIDEGYEPDQADELIKKAKLNCQRKISVEIKHMFDAELKQIVEDDNRNKCGPNNLF